MKKTRRPGAKPKVNLNNLNPTMQSKWDKGQSVKQNFERLGLVMNLRPSMRQTKVGEDLLEHSKIRLNKQFFKDKAQQKKAEKRN